MNLEETLSEDRIGTTFTTAWTGLARHSGSAEQQPVGRAPGRSK